jgi:hypothetical protein
MSRAGPTAQTRYQIDLIKQHIGTMPPNEIARVTGIKAEKVKYLIRHHPDVLLPDQPIQKPQKKEVNAQAETSSQNWGDSPDDFFLRVLKLLYLHHR